MFGNKGARGARGIGDAEGMETVDMWECHASCPIQLMDAQSGMLASGRMKAGQQRKQSRGKGGYQNGFPEEATRQDTYGDRGGASRFFPCFGWEGRDFEPFLYAAKASKKERTEGLGTLGKNRHPTVKPISLMRWLIRLVTPTNGTILDPFAGSGTTGIAAIAEGMRPILCEQDPSYATIIAARMRHAIERKESA